MNEDGGREQLRLVFAKAMLDDARALDHRSATRCSHTLMSIYLTCCEVAAQKGLMMAERVHPDRDVVRVAFKALSMPAKQLFEVLSLIEASRSPVARPSQEVSGGIYDVAELLQDRLQRWISNS